MEPGTATVTPMRASVRAGAISALVGAASFWVFHTLWISGVPFVLLEGVLWALLAGAAVGWAFQHLHEHARFRADWRGGTLLALALWLLLLPYEVVGLALGPFTHLTRPEELLMIAPVGLLSAPLAALLGWALTHRARAAAALAVAALLSHFMIGGSIAYFGGRGAMLGLFAWMLPTYLASGLLFVRLRARFLSTPIVQDPQEVTA